MLQEEIFLPPVWIKDRPAVQRRQLDFLECRPFFFYEAPRRLRQVNSGAGITSTSIPAPPATYSVSESKSREAPIYLKNWEYKKGAERYIGDQLKCMPSKWELPQNRNKCWSCRLASLDATNSTPSRDHAVDYFMTSQGASCRRNINARPRNRNSSSLRIAGWSWFSTLICINV